MRAEYVHKLQYAGRSCTPLQDFGGLRIIIFLPFRETLCSVLKWNDKVCLTGKT